MDINLKKFTDAIEGCKSMRMIGKVVQMVGLVIECQGPNVSMGELCYVIPFSRCGASSIRGGGV